MGALQDTIVSVGESLGYFPIVAPPYWNFLLQSLAATAEGNESLSPKCLHFRGKHNNFSYLIGQSKSGGSVQVGVEEQHG